MPVNNRLFYWPDLQMKMCFNGLSNKIRINVFCTLTSGIKIIVLQLQSDFLHEKTCYFFRAVQASILDDSRFVKW